MNNSLQQLLAERESLDQKIKELQSEGRKEAIATILSLMEQHELKEQDLFTSALSSKTNKTLKTKVPAKYRDNETGKEWSGRGLAPVWLRGKDRKNYLIT